MEPKSTAETIVKQLEDAWNAADGAAFAEPFAPDADFVNIRGDYHSGREAIAAGHQGIFDSIYRGSEVRYSVIQARELDDDAILAHIDATLNVPSGPMAGEINALASIVLVGDGDEPRIAAFHNTVVAGA
jgi:uncharacterized protein (TIGR02246 family)